MCLNTNTNKIMTHKLTVIAWLDTQDKPCVRTRSACQEALEKYKEQPFQSILTVDNCQKLGLCVEGVNDDSLIVMNYLQFVLNVDMARTRGVYIPTVATCKDFSTEDISAWTLKWARAMQQELGELIDSCPWKWWKDMPFDKQNARVEAVDMLHFLLSMMQTLGMTPREILEAYVAKNMVNHQRQNQTGGYTLENKDPHDSRHI